MGKDQSECVSRIFSALQAWQGYGAFSDDLRRHSETSVYLAGGVIRDVVSGSETAPKDFDFFLDGEGVDDFIKCLENDGILLYGPFGSPRWFPKGSEHTYADVIPIKHFFNGLWRCLDIKDVLNQFDLTANAIAIDLRSSHVYDPQNGVRDIEQRILRAVRFDYPDEPISGACSLSRLSVLWHRIKYYAKKTGFRIEPVTEQWLKRHEYYSSDEERFKQCFHLMGS